MLFATGTTVSVPALTGAIMAMGIATANSILVVSFARERLQSGVDSVTAALDAGFSRFRPVLMTALAMIIGMVPMSLGLGEGGEQKCPSGAGRDRGPAACHGRHLVLRTGGFRIYSWFHRTPPRRGRTQAQSATGISFVRGTDDIQRTCLRKQAERLRTRRGPLPHTSCSPLLAALVGAGCCSSSCRSDLLFRHSPAALMRAPILKRKPRLTTSRAYRSPNRKRRAARRN
jgi:hypothetical protein